MTKGQQIITSNGRVFDDAALAAIVSFDDAINLAAPDGALESMSEYGTGFALLENKSVLVGAPFVVLQWRFNEGDFGAFVSAEIVTEGNDKLVLNDGSTGIFQQLREVTDARNAKGSVTPQAGLFVPGGLRKTDYFYNVTTGETANRPTSETGWAKASTYYLSA